LRYFLATAIFISLLFASCAAKTLPTVITVTVADGYSGPIYLSLCQKGAKDPAVVDQQGNGATPACAYGSVEVVVIKAASRIYLSSDRIRVDKTGDGIPVAIRTQIP
jgi:hypothetical protein